MTEALIKSNHLSLERLAAAFESLLSDSGRVRIAQGPDAEVASLVVEPTTVAELGEIVRKCESDSLALVPLAGGNTLRQIRRHPAIVGVSLSRMDRIVNYEPHDMTVVAQAGITLGKLNQAMAEYRQHLPLDPPHPEKVTLGSLVACAKAGPLRLSEGRVRDLLIGIEFIGHQGRAVRAGGRVVKNVAGYDLMKVMTGSYGTLGIITETVFKVRPVPEKWELLLAPFENASDAFEAADGLYQQLPLLHLEVLSPVVSSQISGTRKSLVVAAIGGNDAEVEYQRGLARDRLKGALSTLTDVAAFETYVRLRDVEFEDAAIEAQIAVLPAKLASCLNALQCEYVAYAGSGVARLFAREVKDAKQALELVSEWRAKARASGGHLRVVSLAKELRSAGIAMFDTVNEGAMKLMAELKRRFDPAGIFNPGCFIGGL